MIGFARPRTAAELFTLVLVCLALGTFVSSEIARLLNRSTSWIGLLWSFVLLAGALAARLWPHCRAQLRTLTSDSLRNYAGSILLLSVALSLSWHFLSANLAVGDGYLTPPPFEQAPAAIFLLVAAGVSGVALLARLPVGRWSSSGIHYAVGRLSAARTRQVVAYADVIPTTGYEPDAQGPASASEQTETAGVSAASSRPHSRRQETQSLSAPAPKNGAALPPVEIFVPAPKGPSIPLDLDHKAQRIRETLASFNVSARVVGRHCGPVVTQFDIQPDPGVKVRRITELQNDLALALAAPTIRIQAPVPGKPVVGIEIPNSAAATVALRELLESEAYQSLKSPLKVALGKDVAGNPEVIDLAKMPHLLIAGATGSGKSVCVNAIISCLLHQNSPDQVRLMMIDPKMVELTVYNGVPHLLSPVVTQMDKVVGVLQWALREMERRYQLFADNTVRNIQRYNEKMAAANQRTLPFIVLIVDELADLMMVSPEEVEDAICRLAQLARAAGIHLVIATQRPSVDVVTGLIKANFPARIAFAMTSQVDSRTILDTAGAEKLLGRGDMLYQPPDAPKPVRLQGAHVSDKEIERLVEFWQESPLRSAVHRVPEDEFAAAERAASEAGDDLLDEATRVVREYQHASVSLLQRRLRVGYARAARMMDQLEERGVVGPADGSKQRSVLDEDGFGA